MQSRIIHLTEGDIKNQKLNIRTCGLNFFPVGILGGPTGKNRGTQITINATGLPKPIRTDIPIDKKTGKPRWFFRERTWLADFFRLHRIKPGDMVVIERTGEKTYRVRPPNRLAAQSRGEAPSLPQKANLESPKNAACHSDRQHGRRLLFLDQQVAASSLHSDQSNINARQRNILRSPKKGGSSIEDSLPYLKELGIDIIENTQPIQFTPNSTEQIHRWAPYVQGFSASFVQRILDRYRTEYEKPDILDPFSGCGTVLVQAKLNGHRSVGTELNPLLQFIANTKLNSWDINPALLLEACKQIPRNKSEPKPSFLKSDSQFRRPVLRNLELLNGGIASLPARGPRQRKLNNLLRLAFSAILVECSNLKRSPCLGYVRNKAVDDNAPFVFFRRKVHEIAEDLRLIQRQYKDCIATPSDVICANAMTYRHKRKFDIAITSPPYMNGLDYVMNYKIEMGWLGFVDSQKDLKKIKDDMVVCDNVSKGLIRRFYESSRTYTNDWIEQIKGF